MFHNKKRATGEDRIKTHRHTAASEASVLVDPEVVCHPATAIYWIYNYNKLSTTRGSKYGSLFLASV